jgi:phage shock protein C
MATKKYLYRDNDNEKIFGVCAGLADYFDTDVSVVRLIAVLLVLFAGGGLLAYLIMAIVMEPKDVVMKRVAEEARKNVVNDDPFAKYDK